MNHRIFERILRSRLRPRACLPQRRVNIAPTPPPPIHGLAGVCGRTWSFQLGGVPRAACTLTHSRVCRARGIEVPRPGSTEAQRLTKDPSRAATGWAVNPVLLVVGLGPCAQPSTPRKYTFISRPELRQEHPLNLSISISGGKESNNEALSNGE